MTKWQTIDSAPKDGTWIIIARSEWKIFPKARWEDVDGDDNSFKAWVFADAYTTLGVDDGMLGWQDDYDSDVMPTHWIPFLDLK